MAVGQTTRSGADPRPVVVDGPDGPLVEGVRCVRCGHPAATRVPRCPSCGGETADARFGPDGVIWAATTIHVPSGDRPVPYTLVYVDLDGGPRLLAHARDGPAVGPRPAERVRLVGLTDHGDPLAEVIR